MRKALPVAVLAATAALVLGASPVFAAAPKQQPVVSTASAWTPPADYIHEASFFGAAACQAAGKEGVTEGRWSAYICYQKLPFTPVQELYVKK
ncbi:hypothetical protein AMK16_33035 [Streptomyces sp. CB00455]|uniref:hypothetical protein n=1 Tax=Streptomyces sp. CB00455 TaxID=1703927 RepID=UPI000938C5CF|nr:hypothetical protein [Streptomyces sp. CB00455]OKK11129.1 hypothetical protein AMK16_33035 [Streptomyces sp. CB00455]